MSEILKIIFGRFLADEGIYPAAGIPSVGYLILMGTTFLGIYTALNHTLQWSYERIRKLVKRMILILWGLEIFKIGFRFYYGYQSQLNTWVPLYFCSITLFAGLLSVFGHGMARHIGDVFICVGGLIGGICFLLYPSSSLLLFPADHFLSIHSFLYHGCMTYLGILFNRSGLVKLEWKDMKYYAWYIGFFCVLALYLNIRTGSNLMFISHSFNGTLLDIVAKILGRLYTPALILIQMTVPFQVVMWFKHNTSLLTRPVWYDGIEQNTTDNNGHISKKSF
ncbi:MAG: YwaF family protein [Erysipelotrichaceae bacterium]|nr:YwaF family protein [Erysipelotrichaceae bacterium]